VGRRFGEGEGLIFWLTRRLEKLPVEKLRANAADAREALRGG